MEEDRWVLYSSTHCVNCEPAKKKLDDANIRYATIDITETLGGLKRFLTIRDNNEAFAFIKEKGLVGIPALVKNDGEEVIFNFATLDLHAFPKKRR